MRIAFVSPGAAGMYCGTCLHGNTLVAALQEKGHEVVLIPMYTPIRTDETDVSISQVFYGAVSVYLEQKSALFRHTPWLVDRMLNSRSILNFASRLGASTDARELGELTLSVLEGEEGNQKKELERLVAWLRDDFRPDLVHLSLSLFLGLAGRMRADLSVPVLCSVQGEDLFLDELSEPYRSTVLTTLRRKARDADGFLASSRFYLEHMSGYLGVPQDFMHQVSLGIRMEGLGRPAEPRPERPFTIGYLARQCPEKGLHLLVEAFRQLVERYGRDGLRLAVAGYLSEKDRAYFDGIRDQVREWGLTEVVSFEGEVDRRRKVEFLKGLDVLSVPTTYREPKGLFVLEALACGVPVVQPRHGSFPELLEATGGGLLVEPGSPEALAVGLGRLRDDPGLRAELGLRGQEVVHRRYTDATMAESTLAIYSQYLEGRSAGRPGRTRRG